MRSEPSSGRKMWPTSGAAARECGGSGETKRESSGEEAEQADQLSLLFVSLHYSESRTAAFSSPSLADPADEGRSFYSVACALETAARACVHR